MTYFEDGFAAHIEVAGATVEAVREDFNAMLAAWTSCLRDGGKILLFGNGGSAADAQHIAAELTGRYTVDREPLAGIALTTDTSSLTAVANDYGVDQMFARQLRAVGREGDVAVGISTSGNSPNVLAALEFARANGIVAAGLTGDNGGAMSALADPLIRVPSAVTARIQEMHITIGHLLCGELERALGLVSD